MYYTEYWLMNITTPVALLHIERLETAINKRAFGIKTDQVYKGSLNSLPNNKLPTYAIYGYCDRATLISIFVLLALLPLTVGNHFASLTRVFAKRDDLDVSSPSPGLYPSYCSFSSILQVSLVGVSASVMTVNIKLVAMTAIEKSTFGLKGLDHLFTDHKTSTDSEVPFGNSPNDSELYPLRLP
ncbi:hypothetical protein FHL15_008716 [Xylaria flabelliformis]|uniref:Uncharacterized protein n=1 Tax=Xylaria flabelliformis TaxID=2512241 RepID=A0A553HQX7_9PEZI|nr:hypothetical protein FHL15_008716 [Xylaria flabelliformis]